MTDDVYRELSIRMARVEDTVQNLAQTLSDSGVFEDPSAFDRVLNIGVPAGAGFVTGAAAAAVAGGGALIWGFAGAAAGGIPALVDEFSYESKAEYDAILSKIANDELFREKVYRTLFEVLYATGEMGDADFRSAHDRGWTLLDPMALQSIFGATIEQSGVENSDGLTTGLILEQIDLSQHIPDYLWAMAQDDPNFHALLIEEISTTLTASPELVQQVFLERLLEQGVQDDMSVEEIISMAIKGGSADYLVAQLQTENGMSVYEDKNGENLLSDGLYALLQSMIIEIENERLGITGEEETSTDENGDIESQTLPETVTTLEQQQTELRTADETIRTQLQMQDVAIRDNRRLLDLLREQLTTLTQQVSAIATAVAQIERHPAFDPFQHPSRTTVGS